MGYSSIGGLYGVYNACSIGGLYGALALLVGCMGHSSIGGLYGA